MDFLNPDLPVEQRVADLVSRMTLDEKITQMRYTAPAIERLGIPEYNWWNECLHGVGRAGIATVFPQAIGLAAMWDADLMAEVAEAISEEARAIHHEAVRNGNRGQYFGLTFWTPNINIFRDPRWGRGQETYGEDPYLTARLGVVFVRGLQGSNPTYLKIAACAKHFAVHSGPENERHTFDAVVSERDLWDTYLPAFEALVREADVESVMGAYNRTNGEPCCASPRLLRDILRNTWGFTGHVVSDCWALDDIHLHHKVAGTAAESSALAVNAGCDLECGCTFDALPEAVQRGLVSEETINASVSRLMATRIKLGMFDPEDRVPYASIPHSANDSVKHRALAIRAAQKSIVLLKNDNLLPLAPALKHIAVIGPNADEPSVLLGNYNGTPSRSVTPLQGIRARMPEAEVLYAKGSPVIQDDTSGYEDALRIAARADVVIFVGGLSQALEGEEGQHESVPEGEVSQGDRVHIELPRVQEELLKQLHALNKPVVLVLLNGSAVAVPWADANIPAILTAWYPGEEGGTALADVLFGDYNPGGRLPVTFYRATADLPDFRDYSMANRTYRYFNGEVLYPFGYGLSYTTFAYSNLQVSAETFRDEPITVRVDVQNTGSRAGDEVVQLYIRDVDTSIPVAAHTLQGFTRVHLAPGEVRTVSFTLHPHQFTMVNEAGQRVIEPGEFRIYVGGGQPDRGTLHIGINYQ
jgi:beta-glucosidase